MHSNASSRLWIFQNLVMIYNYFQIILSNENWKIDFSLKLHATILCKNYKNSFVLQIWITFSRALLTLREVNLPLHLWKRISNISHSMAKILLGWTQSVYTFRWYWVSVIKWEVCVNKIFWEASPFRAAYQYPRQVKFARTET